MTPHFIHAISLAKIEFWTKRYSFSFQFWGDGNNNVYINRNDVEVHSAGGFVNIEDVFKHTIEWCEKANPRAKYPNDVEISNPQP